MGREQTEGQTDVGGARKPNTITRSWLVAMAGFPSQRSASRVGWWDSRQLNFHWFRLVQDKPNQFLYVPYFVVSCSKLPLKLYRVSGLELYKNTCLCFSTQKLYAIYVFNSVQSYSKKFLCTSIHFNVGRDVTTFMDETFHGRWFGRGGPTAWPLDLRIWHH